MTDAAWWRSGVIYQIAPRSFCDGNGDGVGDLVGILQRLDHLEWLGVEGVWLCPISPTPNRDFGYDISDFCDVEPELGTMAELDELISALHARDMRLLLDFVPNHTADVHPWFQASRSSRTDPRRDWYVWCDAAANGGPPNNWLGRFGGSAWEWDEKTGQYYYHAFLKEQPDLNWRNPEVREAMYDVMRFWLRRGVDGFRVDAAAVLAEDDLLRDDPPNPEANERTPPPQRQKRVYSDDRPETLGYMEEMRAVVDEFPDRLLLAEVDVDSGGPGRFYGFGTPRFHLPLNYGLIDSAWDADSVGGAIDDYLAAVSPHGWPDWVIGSHDKTRIASRVGQARARLAAMLLFTLPGTAIFYAGDEIGMPDVDVPEDRARDPFGILVPGCALGRDPHRVPMRWSPTANAGFTSGEPWLPVGDVPSGGTVAEQITDPDSMMSLYRRLIAFRRSALRSSDRFRARRHEAGVLLFQREGDGGRYLSALNLSGERRLVDIADAASVRVATDRSREGDRLYGRIELRADEGLVMELVTD
ncbi:MAG TPA: alpha-amylase family glycosyl hydrolase [Novosphingobium sp.]|nr:alpha-amylase family glycosyl hydrolase [Novosphingobium sp.]